MAAFFAAGSVHGVDRRLWPDRARLVGVEAAPVDQTGPARAVPDRWRHWCAHRLLKDCPESKGGTEGSQTHRWREEDSNRRSPHKGELFCETAAELGDDKPAGSQSRILTIDKGRFYRAPSQAGPGNDINAGSPGFQKAPTRGPSSLVAKCFVRAEHQLSNAQARSMRTPTMTRIVARTGRNTFSGTRALRWLPKKMPGREPMPSEPTSTQSTDPRTQSPPPATKL